MLEPVVKSIEVPCGQEKAFRVFVEDINSWWPLHKNTVSAMGGAVAQSVQLEPRVAGRIVETGHDGLEHLWGTVTEYSPHERFTMNWHINMPEESASHVTVEFQKLADDKTRVTLTHSNWEVFGEKADDMRNGYNAGWVGVFEEAYKAACSGG